MRSTPFALPLPLLILLTQTILPTLGLPAPNPLPATTNPTLLESYLDFNTIPSNAIPVSFNAHSLSKRGFNAQSPLATQDPSTSTSESTQKTENCKPPHLERTELNRLLSVLTAEMLSFHSHGIAFPYSATSRSSSSVELTARTAMPSPILPESGDQGDSRLNAKLKIRLTPMGKDNYGMKRVHFASLLERVGSAGLEFEFVGSESEGGSEDGEGKGERGTGEGRLEGVSGDVGFVARLVISPVLGNGCLV
ncbi:hypothetical protein BKA64DRAFT_721030 [Cadophora sp. MPI-SDFR-AT-0126]|nr:hypothetical protein BKA64DRAFT_721030 [Leotiomycetes sp. MPI-SDFR-AT-0126]